MDTSTSSVAVSPYGDYSAVISKPHRMLCACRNLNDVRPDINIALTLSVVSCSAFPGPASNSQQKIGLTGTRSTILITKGTDEEVIIAIAIDIAGSGNRITG